jgi:hypothetical protein
LAIVRGFKIDLFTNAWFSKEIRLFLESVKSNINMFHINIATPVYSRQGNSKVINDFILEVLDSSKISLEVTVWSLKRDIFVNIFELAKPVLSQVYVRLGVDGALVNTRGFSLTKNRLIGSNLLFLSKYLFKRGIRGLWLSEITPCMFTDDELFKFKNDPKISWKGYACFSKNGGVDIKTDLKIIRCFGQECLRGQEVDDKPLKDIEDNLNVEMVKIGKRSLPIECSICKYHGYDSGQCPGPCLIGRT